MTPEAGLLQPQESVPVEIAVNDPQSILRRNAGKETVEIKIFPSLWSTEVSREEIEKCFKVKTSFVFFSYYPQTVLKIHTNCSTGSDHEISQPSQHSDI